MRFSINQVLTKSLRARKPPSQAHFLLSASHKASYFAGMPSEQAPVIFANEDETRAFARAFGRVLRSGDVLLLHGEIGAGKSFFSRALIQSLQEVPEDVPSPTFTLVQTYDTSAGEIWHADLYRLSDPDEAAELGLTEAFETAICLIEWPDRLGETAPNDALHLHFSYGKVEGCRHLALSGGSQNLNSRLKQITHHD